MKRKIWIKIIYAIADILVCFFSSLLTFIYFSRFDFSSFSNVQLISSLIYCLSYGLLHVILFAVFKVYDILSENFTVVDVIKISLISFSISLVGLLLLFAVPNEYLYFEPFELLTWFVSTILTIGFVSLLRLSSRIFGLFKKKIGSKKTIRTLIIGAGSAAKVTIDSCKYNKTNRNKIIVLVDDDTNKIGGMLCNIPVKGPISEINKIIDFYKIEEVIIAIPSLSENRLHEILHILFATNVRVKKIASLTGDNDPTKIKIINIDVDDLLSRGKVELDNHEIKKLLFNECVLVTGAGGSIGSELVRQIFDVHPKKIILFDIYENSTYDIQMELKQKMRDKDIHDVELITLIGATYNEKRVEYIIKKYRPNYIFHAAAYKHVPLMEDSPMEAIRTNVLGTYNVAKMADKYKVKKMILVSTDKAVRPTNVMGTTKRFAETIIQYFSSVSTDTKYAAVRFGNVLNSNGSVVPLFKKQIENGGPVTITHKDIIRYFMTISEAVSLILQCALFANGGEIFILDMGNPVKIITLAEKMIRQAGLIPYVDIDIVEIGLRPGEKLFEELLLDTKHQTKTANKKIFIEEASTINLNLENDIKEACKAFELEETIEIKKLLASLISTYQIKTE